MAHILIPLFREMWLCEICRLESSFMWSQHLILLASTAGLKWHLRRGKESLNGFCKSQICSQKLFMPERHRCSWTRRLLRSSEASQNHGTTIWWATGNGKIRTPATSLGLSAWCLYAFLFFLNFVAISHIMLYTHTKKKITASCIYNSRFKLFSAATVKM